MLGFLTVQEGPTFPGEFGPQAFVLVKEMGCLMLRWGVEDPDPSTGFIPTSGVLH